ncbi:MAG TPA: hypothetical protein VIU64_06630, partial [Polyangia bacterium]
LASLGMRVGLPITFGIIGTRTVHCDSGSFGCGLSELGMGMMIGAVLASALDTTLLSGPGESSGRDSPEAAAAAPDEPRARAGAPATVASTLTPTVAASSNLAFVGVGGRF